MAHKKKTIIRKKHKPGTAPGTLAAPDGAPAPQMQVIAYNSSSLTEKKIAAPEEIIPLLQEADVVWVNVGGLGSSALLEEFGRILNLHMLALEDVLNTNQRPKTEDYGDHLFIVTRMAAMRQGVLDVEQLSMFIGRKFVLTFQETPGDCFDPVRHRIRSGQRLRLLHSDYLGYALIDAVIDGYYPVLEHYGEKLYALEDEVIDRPRQELIARIHDAKRDLRILRHALWPMREMLNGFSADTDVVHEETRPYLRDAHDHIIQVLDMLESYREMASGLLDIYLSSNANRMNEIMKVLTIIATIFMPLSFIASIYGMNFDTASPLNMPELSWRYGYLFALGLMGTVAAGLMFYFKKRGWLGRNHPQKNREK
jgi:magnesium transporter